MWKSYNGLYSNGNVLLRRVSEGMYYLTYKGHGAMYMATNALQAQAKAEEKVRQWKP